MIKKRILIWVLFFSFVSFSQNDSTGTKFYGYLRDTAFCIRHNEYHADAWSKALALKVGYMYSNYHVAELGIGWMNLIGSYCDAYGTVTFAVGSDFLADEKIVFGPKLSAEAHFLFLGTRLNATYYTENFTSGSLKIRPEIGFTLLGYMNVFYGYTFNLSSPLYYNQKHSISIFCNIPTLKFYGQRRIKHSEKQ
jgi:hypothetical protein